VGIIDPKKLPRHIAMIMDGNGRWAQKRLLPRSLGHREGVKTLEKIMAAVYEFGVEYLTVYAFSSENKARPKKEVDNLLKLLKEYFTKKLKTFIKEKIRIKVIGDRSFFDENLNTIILNAESETAGFVGRNFVIALNYGARDEMIRAVNRAVEKGKKVSEEEFARLLDTKDIPDPDLIIRTGGDFRLSNFLLFQASYAELAFVDVLWPDFNKTRLEEILADYCKRNRRFGKVEDGER